MIGGAVGNYCAVLGDRSGEITLEQVGAGQPPPALPRIEAVTDGIGKVASFFCGCTHRDGVARDEGDLRLLPEDR